MNLDSLYKNKASLGRYGDTELRMVDGITSHVNPEEAHVIDMYGSQGEKLVKSVGSGTINPNTGLPEYSIWATLAAAASSPAWAGVAAAATIGGAIVGLLSESSAGATKEKQAKMSMDHADDKKDLLNQSLLNLNKVQKSGEGVISAGYVTGVDDLSFGVGNKYVNLKGGYESKASKANLVYGTAEKSYEQATDILTEGFERKRGSLYDDYTQKMTDFDSSIQAQRDDINAQMTSADHQADLASIESKAWYPGKWTGKLLKSVIPGGDHFYS